MAGGEPGCGIGQGSIAGAARRKARAMDELTTWRCACGQIYSVDERHCDDCGDYRSVTIADYKRVANELTERAAELEALVVLIIDGQGWRFWHYSESPVTESAARLLGLETSAPPVGYSIDEGRITAACKVLGIDRNVGGGMKMLESEESDDN